MNWIETYVDHLFDVSQIKTPTDYKDTRNIVDRWFLKNDVHFKGKNNHYYGETR